MRQNEREESGQALVEFALLFTFLTLLVMGVLAFGLILTTQISLVGTARAAARRANLNDSKTAYCNESPGGHYNEEVYDTTVNALAGLPMENLEAVLIFRGDSGLNPNMVDVLDGNGNELSGCYDLNGDGTCDCPGTCEQDVNANTFENSERCDSIAIGVQVMYEQEVPVPLLNWITGDSMILRARAIFELED